MSSKSFKFKQFEVSHDLCAMKVGTDGVLLGAWTDIQNTENILDAGTGSGLIALMLAQRSKAVIDAIEIDKGGYLQSCINFSNSPWHQRLNAVNEDFRNFKTDKRYDLIVSNPPFFRNSLKAGGQQRSIARHDDTLSWEQLVEKSFNFLNSDGRLSVIIPAEGFADFHAVCITTGFNLKKKCNVYTKVTKSAKRVMLEYSKNSELTKHTDLILADNDNKRSEAYSALTCDFYL